MGSSVLLIAQSSIQLLDLSAFRQPVKENWKITGDLTGDNFSGGPLKTLTGQGVQTNLMVILTSNLIL
jgi:hypothetical protein